MLGFLSRLWAKTPAVPPQSLASMAVGAVATAPARTAIAQPVAQPEDSGRDFVRRESLLERGERIAGYRFSLRATLQSRIARGEGVARRAYDAALLTRMALQGDSALLGQRLAFIGIAADALHDPHIDALPKPHTVLMLEPGTQAPRLEGTQARLAQLRQQGLLLGLCVQDAASLAGPLAQGMDFFEIDVSAFNGLELRELVAQLHARPSARAGQHALLVARGVPSHDDFLFCQKCGFDFFHGPFVSSGQGQKLPISGGINRMVVLPILNMVRADASFAAIAEQLKNEPTLSNKLLRYLNSPAMGLQMRVESLTDALVLIGREKFYRWMSLLLFDFTNPSYRERMLAERALARGRTLELLAGQGHIPPSRDALFLTGLFSLLDQTLDLPMAELLQKAALPEAVSAALLGQSGALADALHLVTLGESDAETDAASMAQALAQCGVDDRAFSAAATAALVWAHQALGSSE